MSKIKIKNFGPIREGCVENDGWIDIKKVTLFIGNQGSGKSTVAKLISTFSWIEKALVRGDYDKKWFEKKSKLRNQYLVYHHIENYFKNNDNKDISEIDYIGEAYHITYKNGNVTINSIQNSIYLLPQIMYVPAERNFISNVKTPKALKLTSDSLIEFVTEFDNAKNEMKGLVRLPINDVDIEFDKLNDVLNIKGKDYKVKLTEASSGFQSVVPLYLVSKFLSNEVKKQTESKEPMSSDEQERFRKGVKEIWSNENLTDEQKRIALSVLSAKFNKTVFVNIVEEPEQNLFPSSQKKMLYSLLEYNNMNAGNKLIMTSHSPYLINYLTLAVKANSVKSKLSTKESKDKLNEIVPVQSTVDPDDLIIYELNEADGSISKLKSYKGLPSDENYLNESLGETNDLFSQLQQIEKGWL